VASAQGSAGSASRVPVLDGRMPAHRDPRIPTWKMVTVKEDKAGLDQEEEWIRQNNLAYVGLMGVGVVMVQPFLTAPALDLSAVICVVAFSVAIPLLAALAMVNQQEAFRRRATNSMTVSVAKAFAQMCAFVGLVAAFWHILWIAGVGILASGIVGVAVYSAGYVRLELSGEATSREAEESSGSES
jgi:hypothetical protein